MELFISAEKRKQHPDHEQSQQRGRRRAGTGKVVGVVFCGGLFAPEHKGRDDTEGPSEQEDLGRADFVVSDFESDLPRQLVDDSAADRHEIGLEDAGSTKDRREGDDDGQRTLDGLVHVAEIRVDGSEGDEVVLVSGEAPVVLLQLGLDPEDLHEEVELGAEGGDEEVEANRAPSEMVGVGGDESEA